MSIDLPEHAHHTRYKTPWRGYVRALERNIIKFRAIQSILVIYYTEILIQKIVDTVKSNTRRSDIGLKKALNMLVDEGVIPQDKAKKIKRLKDYRNDLAHEFHKMNSDLSNLYYSPVMDNVKEYNYAAIRQLKEIINYIYERVSQTSGWTNVIGLETIDFETPESILTSELKRLDKKITRLYNRRKIENDQINREIEEMREKFSDRLHSPWLLKHANGRLSAVGVELCDSMFKSGYSALAVAYLLEISITSARSRQRAFLIA